MVSTSTLATVMYSIRAANITIRRLSLESPEWGGMSHQIMERRWLIGALKRPQTVANGVRQSLHGDALEI